MADDGKNQGDDGFRISRRSLLTAAGLGGVGLAAGPLTEGANATAFPGRVSAGSDAPPLDPVDTPRVAGLHLQFGTSAATEVVVSWHSLEPVRDGRVLLARYGSAYERSAVAETVSYKDAKSGQVVYAHHARLGRLKPNTVYVYAALHAGAQPELGSFRTAPQGRAAFTFTSFGDQGTPTLGKPYTPPPGRTITSPPFVNDNLGSPAAGDVTSGVERVQPLFHLFNGDLCYANLANDRGSHLVGLLGEQQSQCPQPAVDAVRGQPRERAGERPDRLRGVPDLLLRADRNRAGQLNPWPLVRVHGWFHPGHQPGLANDDVCYQDGGNSYIRGYSHGAQKAWLENELANSRSNADVDWVVVCMHQVVVSTADKANGADLGIRQEWVPLFDRYGVDLVVCGHEHHYERSHPIRGQQPNPTLTPVTAATRTDVVDTTLGTVHMVIGGGTSVPSNQFFFDPPQCRVITAVGEVDPSTGKRPPVYVTESAPWSAVRDAAHSYVFGLS